MRFVKIQLHPGGLWVAKVMTDATAQELVIDKTSLQLPPVSLVIQVLIVVVGLLSYFSPNGVGAWLALHPVAFLPPNFRLWVVATYVFVDLDIVNLFITIVSFPIFGKVMLPSVRVLWGSLVDS